jgi:hypothetical protein
MADAAGNHGVDQRAIHISSVTLLPRSRRPCAGLMHEIRQRLAPLDQPARACRGTPDGSSSIKLAVSIGSRLADHPSRPSATRPSEGRVHASSSHRAGPTRQNILAEREPCLAAEHCWDPVQYVIETEGWRFDGLRSRRRQRRRNSCQPKSRGGRPGQPRRRRQAVARQGQG